MTKDIAQPDLALDKSSEQGFLRYFATLTAQENTIRLFERSNGDYYSVHGTDAEHVAQAVYKTRTVIKHLGTPKLPTCTMSRAVAEGFLRDALLQRGQRIEIHAQEAAGWTVSKRASPGNLQAVEAMLFGSSDMVSAPLMAVRVRASAEQMHVGVATVDAAQRVLGVCEFIDSSAFANLEALVIQLGVRECLIESDEEAVGGVLQRCMVVPTELPKKLFSADGVAQDLARLLPAGVPVQGLAELELRHALGALGACLGYLQLAADDAGFGGYALHTHVPGKFMKLDASAVSALSLLQSPDGASRTMSLQGLLNRCKTPQGRRLLDQWLKQPLLSEPEINERLDLVGVFFNNAEARDTLRSTHLRSLPDLKRLATRLQRLQATLQDIVRIYQVAEGLSALCDTLEPLVQMHGAVDAAYLGPLRSCDGDLAPLRQMVETTVDLDMAERHEFVLRADFDEGLQETRR
ncbi:MSH2 protein, partial [Coemansia sp. RSA 2603]